MEYKNILAQEELREIKPNILENEEATRALEDFFKQNIDRNFSYKITGEPMDDLLYSCFAVKGTPNEHIMAKILESHNFNYINSIHNAIYYMLGQKEELNLLNTNPLLWPGIKSMTALDSTYTVTTKIGTIKVSRASKIFENSKSAYIFKKPLMGECYYRTYDFLKENKNEYKVVLSYMPNFFHEGHYHAYLENNTHILDIASNAYYTKEEAKKVLCGDVIVKLTYDEIEAKINELEEKIPEVKEKSKLHALALYYDIKKVN